MSVAPSGRAIWSWIRGKTTTALGFDPHSIALFRIALALLVLWTLTEQAGYLYELYDDRGLVPRAVILYGSENEQYDVSIFNISGWWPAIAALFLVHGLAAISLAVGHRTRLAAAINWFMLASMSHRHPMPEIAGDTYMRVCSFWALFLPLDAAWAVDAPPTPRLRRAISPGSVALLGQICLMYVASVYQKNGDAWVRHGTALFHACNIPEVETPISRYVVWLISTSRVARNLGRLASPTVLLFEYYTPWLLLSPIWSNTSRALGAGVLIAMHLTFAATLNIWRMSLQFIAPLICVLPTTSVWERRPTPLQPEHPDPRTGRVDMVKYGGAWALCLLCLTCVTFTTLGSTDAFGPPPSPLCHDVVQVFVLQQEWRMFAPEPTKWTFRHEIEGTLTNDSAPSVRLRLSDPHADVLEPFDPDRYLLPSDNIGVPAPLMRIIYSIYTQNHRSEPKDPPSFGMHSRLFMSAIGRYMCRESKQPLSGLKIWEIAESSIYTLPTRIHYHTKVIWEHQCHR